MSDPFTTYAKGFGVASGSCMLMNTGTFPVIPRGISFTQAGTIQMVDQGGATITLPSGALSAGVIHAVRPAAIISHSVGTIIGWL